MHIYYICNQYANWKTYTGRKEQDKEVMRVKNGLVIKQMQGHFPLKEGRGLSSRLP